jgi:hypothetical protein
VVTGGVPPLHAPALHVCPLVQALPHVPQLAPSVIRLVQVPEQPVCPPLHAHMLPVQVWPAPQALPHMPQFAGSVLVSTHAVLPVH